MNDRKISISDLITTGVFSAIYFILVTVATFGSAILIPGYSYVFLPAVAALISGSVYMLLVAKVHKFGAITLMGVVMSIYFFISGHFVLSFLPNLVCGIVADRIAKQGDYKSKKHVLLSYIVFSFGLTGPVLPMWFMQAQYIANLQARGKSEAYISAMFQHMTLLTFAMCVIAILVCGLLGGWFGQKMMKKHFEKAGVVSQ
jgi:energy-coupling factor transport system substrate-specific component